MTTATTVLLHAQQSVAGPLLDEPANNLGIQNLEILTAAINNYRSPFLMVSHDEYFQEQLGVEPSIELRYSPANSIGQKEIFSVIYLITLKNKVLLKDDLLLLNAHRKSAAFSP